MVTEASSKRRASNHCVAHHSELAALDPGRLEPLACGLDSFRTQLLAENLTLKRWLTDPRNFGGVRNACSDEILHAEGRSPVKRSQRLQPEGIERLWWATREVLQAWGNRLVNTNVAGFPEQVTAFR